MPMIIIIFYIFGCNRKCVHDISDSRLADLCKREYESIVDKIFITCMDVQSRLSKFT